MALEEFLEILADPSADVANADFVEISDLSPSELGGFARAWFTMPIERKRWIITSMVELAEDNPELDFCAVFKMGLKDQDELVQAKAIEGLWEYEDRSIITGLVQILRSDRSPEVRSAAAAALEPPAAAARRRAAAVNAAAAALPTEAAGPARATRATASGATGPS